MDSIILFPPGASGAGSQLQLGTYLMADPGANYGAQGLLQSLKSANALSDGGRFGFRYAPVRQMAIPLLLRDVPGQTLLQTESLLRTWTTPGAYVALQPETIPSGQAVFFDILDGRWEPDYSTFENRVGRRKGTLFLDTQPFGYWPTEILLASTASVGFMGQLAVPGGSVIGDVSPLARIQIQPTVSSGYASFCYVDMAAVSFGARPSFNPFIPPAVFWSGTLTFNASPGGGGANVAPTLLGDPFAPASQAIAWGGSNGFATWSLAAFSATQIPSALEPAYRGRFRVFGFFKQPWGAGTPSTVFSAIVDGERAAMPSIWQFGALASGNQLGTIVGGATNVVNSFLGGATNSYNILDLGEITLPAGGGSGLQESQRLRIWLSATGVGAATLAFGGLYLLPIDGAAGILTRGGAVPTLGPRSFGQATQGGFEWNTSFAEQVLITNTSPGLAPVGGQPQPVIDARAYYRGAALRLSATTQQLTLLTGDRKGDNLTIPNAVFNAGQEYSQVSVSYRPSFQFLYGI